MLKKIIQFIKKLLGTKTRKNKDEKTYAKKPLLTKTEIKFKAAIEKCLPNNYILYPQINLASIIKRVEDHKYQNELYRNVDFCVFDDSYNPLLIIEINDKTHKEKRRQARDIKVQNICENAGIPIIKFWTDYGIKEDYIEKKIKEYIK